MCHRALIACLLSTLFAGAALAQDVKVYRNGEAVDPNEVAAILAPAQPGGKMRSIRLLDETQPRQQGASVGAAGHSGSTTQAAPTALALPVQFAFDSAEILPAARQQLDAVAQGILMLPTPQAVVIEGHTDAVGTEQYNEQLSQRRAAAVKRYLVAAHHIDPARLRAVGMGEHAPLAGRDPLAAENRRVQFRGE